MLSGFQVFVSLHRQIALKFIRISLRLALREWDGKIGDLN